MPIPRKEQVNLDSTVFYHCTTRCVQQCFLLGIDPITGQNFEHRKAWIEEQIHKQASAFCIDVCAYAIMSNHTHLVLQVNPELAKNLSDDEVCARWQKVAKLEAGVGRYLVNKSKSTEELRKAKTQIAEYRRRLFDLSSFMGMLNWRIARRANKEQGRKGHFWESRFQSQALLDDGAVLACMAYVDLNPIRAKIASSLETSSYTSIRRRLRSITAVASVRVSKLAMVEPEIESVLTSLPCHFYDYVKLLEATAKSKHCNDRRAQRTIKFCGIRPSQWDRLISNFEDLFDFAVGSPGRLAAFKQKQGRCRVKGLNRSNEIFV